MSWNLEGRRVIGMYMGEFPVAGVVRLSRVKYGGGVSHHVELDAPIKVYSAVRDRVILDEPEVKGVL
jgi:hypothetical protein